MRYLLDVNVPIALVDPAHVHHDPVHDWFAKVGARAFATCPITENGLLQAVAAGQQLGTFDAVWASTLQRAAHTAAIIAETIGVGPVQTHPGLMEAAFGPWQGLTVTEIEAGWPGYLEAHRRPDGAETPDRKSVV